MDKEKFTYQYLRKNINKVNSQISKVFYSIIMLHFPLIVIMLNNYNPLLHYWIIFGISYFFIMERMEKFNPVYVKNCIIIGMSMFYTVSYILLCGDNTSSPQLFYIGILITTLYFNQKSVMLYSLSIVIFNIIGFIFIPTVYLLNHTHTNWFFMFLFHSLMTLVSVLVIETFKSSDIVLKLKINYDSFSDDEIDINDIGLDQLIKDRKKKDDENENNQI